MGSHAKQQNSLLDASRKKADDNYDAATATSTARSKAAYDQAGTGRSGLNDRYSALSDNGGFSPEDIARYRSTYETGGSPGGNYSAGGSSVADELANTGGIDESVFGSALKGYESFASGGGIDADAMRQRANSVIPSFYKNLKNEAARRKMVNPYAPTFDASSASMARQAGQQTQENVRDTELSIDEAANANKRFGIQGLGSLNSNIQGMKQSGKIAGGGQQIANAGLGLDAARLNESVAGRRMEGEGNILSMQQQGRLAGLGGLANLYGSDLNEARGYSQDAYGGYGARAGNDVSNISQRQDTSKWWKDLAKQGLSAGAAVMTGGLSLGAEQLLKRKAQSSGSGGGYA